MRTLSQLILTGFLLMVFASLSAQPSIGGYNVYYGHLHNHCSFSDGTGTASAAYDYARHTGGLDFFSLADHSGSLDAAEWATMKRVADSCNVDNVFTTFWGFEWTHSTIGHVAVIGSASYVTTASPCNTFTGLCDWLNANECVAFFNHPGRQNSTGAEFAHFATTPTEKFIGMELWNKTDRFEDYYYNDGYYSNDGNLGYIDEALARDWKIGAAGSEDNHSGTWGTMTPSKLAVLATANTRSEIMAALKARRFYSTYDKTLALSFKINGYEMGSTITGGSYTLQILASDATGDNFSKVELLKNGVVQNTWTPGSNSVSLTASLNFYDGEYYYVRVKQSDADEAITSPIWIEGGLSNISPDVTLTAPAGNSVAASPASFTLTAEASDSDGSVTKVDFYQGTTLLGTDTSAPYTCPWSNVPSGVYEITAKATDNLGSVTISGSATVIVYNPDVANYRSAVIATGLDDVEENIAGTIYTNSTDIELVYDSYNSNGNQIVGLRFINLYIPQGAEILNSYIQFTCDEATTSACNVVIRGEAADNSAAFTTTAGNVSGRSVTSSSVAWIPAAWNTAGEAGSSQQTPDLSAILQEIVDRPGYTPLSPVTLIITGTGTRTAEAYEGSAASAARLILNYTLYSEVTPVFDPIGPLCQNSTPPALPATSTNGITGTWSPAVISTGTPGTTVYTFTPDAGQHAVSATLPVTVDPLVTPLFTQIGPLNQGSTPPSRPAVSTNGITGTWSPSAISTSAPGSYTYTFTPTSGHCVTTATMVIEILPVTTGSVSVRISTGNDDVEEYNSGTMLLGDSDIDLVFDSKTTGNQKVGLRFNGIGIPQGASITSAYIQFTVDKVTTATTKLTLYGQDADNAAAFTSTKKNVSNRTKTTAYASWTPVSWSTTGALQQTSDLKTVVQEILDRSGWESGNSMAFIITGTCTRTAVSFEKSSGAAALLYVEYTASLKAGSIPASVSSCTMTGSLAKGRLTCFPVPFSEALNIAFEPAKNENLQKISVYNASGNLLKELVTGNNLLTIPMQGFQPGMYLISVITDQNRYVQTVVKK